MGISVKPPALHPTQARAYHDPARFRVLACGRRWGKTRMGSLMCVQTAVRGGRAWWVAPSYPVSQVGWRLIRKLAAQVPGVDIRKGELMVIFPGGGSVRVRSADNPDSLRGEGLDLVVMDECAFIQEEAWTEAIRPALSDRKGRAVFISTPKGRNWFWRAFQRGLDHNGEWSSYQVPTADNPYIDPAEIEAARLTLPERIYQQEYEAKFLEDGGGVFRNVQACATATALDSWAEGRQFVAGVDVASLEDFTVASVIDAETGELVYLDRFNRVDYPTLEDRLKATYNRFHLSAMAVETNGIGRPVIDHLVSMGLDVQPFTTTNATKAAIIQGLQSAFEHGSIKVLNDPVLIDELLSFEGTRNNLGNMSYSAPAGCHDDCVMSLAIAWNAIQRQPAVIDDPFAAW